MNRIVLIVVGLALILGVVFYAGKKKGEPGTPGAPGVPTGTTTGQASAPGGESGAMTSGGKSSAPGATVGGSKTATPGAAGTSGVAGTAGTAATAGTSGTAVTVGTVGTPGGAAGTSTTSGTPGASGAVSGQVTGGKAGATTPSAGGATAPGAGEPPGEQVAIPKVGPKDTLEGVDGNVGKVSQPGVGDDGDMATAPKAAVVQTLAGIKGPKVWLVAADLKKLPSAKGTNTLEIGNAEGAKATPWKNRTGNKYGDGLRAKGGTNATFCRGVQTSRGTFDAVAFCAPGVKECVNSAPSQIKLGLDINHPDSWVAGADATGKSANGGSSFTALFVAARGSQAANPLMENQNGEAGAKKGPFLGWIGPDLVGSIHGLQGIVGLTSVSVPNSWSAGITPQIYTLRFDRKKSELKLFLVADKGSAAQSQAIEKGDGPDNDQYAAIAIGSKNPGNGAVTYVFEAATFSRALEDREICSIHKEWNKRYSLNIPASQLKPCP